jgi:hypothetical protein
LRTLSQAPRHSDADSLRPDHQGKGHSRPHPDKWAAESRPGTPCNRAHHPSQRGEPIASAAARRWVALQKEFL